MRVILVSEDLMGYFAVLSMGQYLMIVQTLVAHPASVEDKMGIEKKKVH